MEIPFIQVKPGFFWPVFRMVSELQGEKGTLLKEKKEQIEIDPELIRTVVTSLSHVVRNIIGIKKIIIWFLGKIYIRNFNWITEIGTGEPAKTGIVVGVLWSAKSLAYSSLQKSLRKTPLFSKVNVIPNFQNSVLVWDMDCIFDVSCGHIIIGGIKMMWYLLIKKGGISLERPSH